MRKVFFLILLVALAIGISPSFGNESVTAQANVPSFPGAEGFGAVSVGGRGGRIIEVTTLEDNEPAPPGSLRAAVEAAGPRIVVFRVGGIITLKSRLTIRNPFITIAGQTAPGDGILITGHSGLGIITNDVIIRHLRIRLSGTGQPRRGQDPFSIRNGAENVMIDHCSLSWSLDKVLVGRDVDLGLKEINNITFQRCIIAEGLWPHSTALLINGNSDYSINPPLELQLGVNGISIHHNLFVHNTHRNPKLKANTVEVINNVVYNWKSRVGSSVSQINLDLLNNYWKPGPMSHPRRVFWHESTENTTKQPFPDPSINMAGNIVEGRFEDASGDNWWMMTEAPFFGGGPLPESYRRFNPITPSDFPITVHSAFDALDSVLNDSGANATLDCLGNWTPNVDAVDIRVTGDVRNGTGWSELPPTSPEEAGGFPIINDGTPCEDSDRDGMPNEWESLHGFNPQSSSDSNQDADKDGYTNVEEYLNGSGPLTAEVQAVVPTATATAVPTSLPIIGTPSPSTTPTTQTMQRTVTPAEPIVVTPEPTPLEMATPIVPTATTLVIERQTTVPVAPIEPTPEVTFVPIGPTPIEVEERIPVWVWFVMGLLTLSTLAGAAYWAYQQGYIKVNK